MSTGRPPFHYYSGRLRSLRGYRAQIEMQSGAARVEVTRDFPCVISITNTGTRTWRRGGWHPVHLSYHWRVGDRAIEGKRFSLPANVRSGEKVSIECLIPAPAEQGNYVLEFDLVRELVGWFKDHGSPPLRIQQALHDYDYHTTYREADLEKDYWSVVGPTTREEYELLGRAKRQTLIDLGMTEHASVLDVGCGTGQLAEALLDYLSDRGLYYGTDLSEEAVSFCRKKFRRPNFIFRRNEMTSVETDGRRFDVIFLGSVFTHMYPAEIKAMLLDLRRQLAPRGIIVADAFVSSTVPTFAGSRARVEINEGVLLDAFRETGLTFERHGAMAQAGSSTRFGFVFRQPDDSPDA